jgi:hypothetical protein
MPWKRGSVFACLSGFQRRLPGDIGGSEWRRLPSGWKMKRSPSTATLLAVITVFRPLAGGLLGDWHIES